VCSLSTGVVGKGAVAGAGQPTTRSSLGSLPPRRSTTTIVATVETVASSAVASIGTGRPRRGKASAVTRATASASSRRIRTASAP
jgi:hypothetical protein